MNKREARAVIEICLDADSGCQDCARASCKDFIAKFPKHAELCRTMFKKKFEYLAVDW